MKPVSLQQFCWPYKSSVQTMTTLFIYLFFWQKNKRQPSLKCGSKQLNESTKQVRSYLTAYSKQKERWVMPREEKGGVGNRPNDDELNKALWATMIFVRNGFAQSLPSCIVH